MTRIKQWFSKAAHETGQTVIEYTMVIGVIVVGLFLAFQATPIKTAIGNGISNIVSAMGATL